MSPTSPGIPGKADIGEFGLKIRDLSGPTRSGVVLVGGIGLRAEVPAEA
jgi:hypothetical protein